MTALVEEAPATIAVVIDSTMQEAGDLLPVTKGQARLFPLVAKRCNFCGGSGRRTCPICGGRGCGMCDYPGSGEVDCPDCNGSGER